MKMIYIAGPYRSKTIDGVERNISKARSWARYFWKKGYAVFCPHLNAALMDGIVDDQVFLDGEKVILSKCDLIFMMPNWERSEGARGEFYLALERGIRRIINDCLECSDFNICGHSFDECIYLLSK